MKKRIWAIGAAGIVAIGVWGAFLITQDLSRVETGEHATRLSWLPPEATDICYYKSYLMTAAEFRISEADFKRWCDGRGYPLNIISDTPFRIRRYSWPDANKRANELAVAETHPAIAEQEQSSAERASLEIKEFREVHHGSFYRKEFENGGGVAAAYDSDNHMGYFESSPH